jgi:hypothetical protein
LGRIDEASCLGTAYSHWQRDLDAEIFSEPRATASGGFHLID